MRADEEWKSWSLFLLLDVFAKCLEAFVCDLGQCDAVASIDPLDLIF